MPYQCERCQSLFFKTLETRRLLATFVILYKKRCKRCKQKALLRQDFTPNATSAGLQPSSVEEWRDGIKVTLPTRETVKDRGHIFVSDYTRRISRPPEISLPYLSLIASLEQGLEREKGHESADDGWPEMLANSPIQPEGGTAYGCA